MITPFRNPPSKLKMISDRENYNIWSDKKCEAISDCAKARQWFVSFDYSGYDTQSYGLKRAFQSPV